MICKNLKVSVLMPVYNTKEEYLRQAIESILNQTFEDFEFIILNDGSTNENIPKVILSYKDKRIKFINNSNNHGLISSLNQCLDVAQGEYIAKMDSDDISLPKRLEKQVEYLDTHPEVGLVGAGLRYFDKADRTIILEENVSLLDLLKECCTTICMFRNSIVQRNNLRFRKEYIHAEDYDFYARFIKSATIHNIEEVLYLYRWHGENVSITKASEQLESSNKVRQDILNFLTDDKELQQKILTLVCPQPTVPMKYTFLQKIFSLRNQKTNGKKKKILMILGIRFVVGEK